MLIILHLRLRICTLPALCSRRPTLRTASRGLPCHWFLLGLARRRQDNRRRRMGLFCASRLWCCPRHNSLPHLQLDHSSGAPPPLSLGFGNTCPPRAPRPRRLTFQQSCSQGHRSPMCIPLALTTPPTLSLPKRLYLNHLGGIYFPIRPNGAAALTQEVVMGRDRRKSLER